MIFDPPPRRRAVARVLWPLLIAVAVIAALVISAAGEETRAELEYLEEVQAQAFEISKGGDALRGVMTGLERIERIEFETVVEDIGQDLSTALDYVSADPPTASLLPVRALYRQALNAWGQGMASFATALLAAADDPSNVVAVDSVAEALADLRSGDELYEDLVAEMDREDVPSALTDMPRVVLMPAEGSLLGLSLAYVDMARSPQSGLALRPGLGLSQIVAEPEWQVNTSNQTVVPATDTIVFSVVVTNLGNVASGSESLLLTLTGGPEQVKTQSEVAPLEPNQQTTLVFDPFEVEPGGIYEIEVTLLVTGGDSNLSDNQIVVEFHVNEG